MNKNKRNTTNQEFDCMNILIIPEECRKSAMDLISRNATDKRKSPEDEFVDGIEFIGVPHGIGIIERELNKFIDIETFEQLINLGCGEGTMYF